MIANVILSKTSNAGNIIITNIKLYYKGQVVLSPLRQVDPYIK